MLIRWLSAFLFGQAIEVPIYTLALRYGHAARDSVPLTLCIAFGATALTHPLVWFYFPELIPAPYWLMVLCAETFAVVAEALYFWLFGLAPSRALAASLLANGASCGLGLLSRHYLGWP